MVIDHGTFHVYTPTLPVAPAPPVRPVAPPKTAPPDQTTAYRSDLAVWERQQRAWEAAMAPIERLRQLIEVKAIFARRSDGEDWYDYTRATLADRHYCMVVGGRVVSTASDAQLFAVMDGMSLLETDDRAVSAGWAWDGRTFSPPRPEVARVTKILAEDDGRLSDSDQALIAVTAALHEMAARVDTLEALMGRVANDPELANRLRQSAALMEAQRAATEATAAVQTDLTSAVRAINARVEAIEAKGAG